MFTHPTILTLLAVLAFAANSVLCRLALETGSIDAATFTLVRVLSGALVLLILVGPQAAKGRFRPRCSWRSALALSVYLVCFSFAYRRLPAGAGALILFAAVQFIMFAAAWHAGERYNTTTLAGLALAAAGLGFLLMPDTEALDATGAMLMFTAGVAWGVYSLIGRFSHRPLNDAYASFVLAAPICALLMLPALSQGISWSGSGLLLAGLSGGIASAIGYAAWYAALPHLRASSAAAVQLTVPVLAAMGGILLLDESITWPGLLAGLATLAGVWLALRQKTAQEPAIRTQKNPPTTVRPRTADRMKPTRGDLK